MRNFIEVGDVITIPAPVGGVVSGQLVVAGSLLGVAETTAAVGVPVAIKVGGVFELPKVSAQAWTLGQPVYTDGTLVTNAATGSVIGYATEAAANPSSVGRVHLKSHL